MELIPADGNCIVSADGTIVWCDTIFQEWFAHRGVGPGTRIGQLFPGSRDLGRPGAIHEDADKLGKRRYFALECRPTLGLNGEKISEEVRIRKVTHQRVLTDIARLSTQTKSSRDLFDKVLWLLRDTTHYLAFAGYIACDGRVELVASKGWTEKLKSYVALQDVAPDSGSLAGRTAYHRRQAVMAMKDYALSPAVKSAINKIGGEYIVVTPLIDQDKLVGVLTVIDDKVLTPMDSEALLAICNQVAVVLDLKLQEEAALVKSEDAVLFANVIARAVKDDAILANTAVESHCGKDTALELVKRSGERDASTSALLRSLNENVALESIPLKEAIAYAVAGAKDLAQSAHKKMNVRISGQDSAQIRPLLKYAAYEVLKNSVQHSASSSIEAEIRALRERSGAHRLEISDNGPGIPDEFKSEVFRPYKANMKNPGGLGLYLVKRIANKYGGRVWVEDRVHGDHRKGVIVVITIPAK